MKYDKLAEDLLNEVGGAANVIDSYHCVTRLRLTLVNTARADTARIALLDDVVGAQVKGDELQVIIGPGVADAYAAFTRRLPAEKRSVRPPAPAASPADTPGPSLGSRIIGFLAGVFVPIIPALAGAGMVKSLIALLTALGWLPADSGVAAVLNIVGDGVFYFLPFFLAVSAARRVKTNEYLALAVATSLLYPTLTAGAAAGAEPLSFLGLPLPMVNYASSVIPILLGVVLLSIVSRLLDRFVHRNIKIVVVPLLSLLIVIPVTLTLLAPLGYYAGTLLASGVEWIFSVSGIVASAVLGAALPLIVMTGMHAVFAPIILGNLGSSGIDVILPLFFFGSLAVSGAALAVFVRTRDAKRKATALSAGLSAFIGITEPATWGQPPPSAALRRGDDRRRHRERDRIRDGRPRVRLRHAECAVDPHVPRRRAREHHRRGSCRYGDRILRKLRDHRHLVARARPRCRDRRRPPPVDAHVSGSARHRRLGHRCRR